MDRRAFLGTLGLLAAPRVAEGQQAGPRHQLGLLIASAPGRPETAFREGLRALGYVDGRNVVVDSRTARGRLDRLPALVLELLGAKPEVIVTFGTAAAQAAKAATTTTPIVMAFAGDPLGTRIVASLAKPGGNITGMSLATPELAGKRLEFLKEVVPKLTRLTVVGDPSHRQVEVRQTQKAAAALGLTLALIEVTRAEGLDTALGEVARARPQALLVLNSSLTVTHRSRIIDFALKHRVPLVSSTSDWAAAGALIAYAPSITETCRRAAAFVDKILKGANPADLPIEQPTKFELVINLKTAKALGLTIPPTLLQRADQVIE
jgi:putative tryptophan/tyrosine transport system substrate-binding protein